MIKDKAKNRKNKAYTTFGSMAPISNNAIKSYPILDKQLKSKIKTLIRL